MKTPIRRLDSLTHNDTAATKLINDNFEALQQGIEDALSRSGKTPNYMDASLDMNMNRIINIATPVDDYDLANKKYVDTTAATLSDAIAAESARAVLAEQGLAQGITDEELRAKAAEKAITDTLDTYGDVVTHDADEFATAAQGAKADTALQPADLGNATLTIKKNNTSVGTFTANSKTDTDINITVPTSAAEVNALPDSTKYAANISLTINSSTYVLTAQLKDQDGNSLGSAQNIDLPLESVVVGGEYDSSTQSIILTLDNGNTITIPVGALINGLQEEITSSNKLDADLVDDSTSTNKFVTASEKTTWNGKQDSLTAGENISIVNNVISATGGTDIIQIDSVLVSIPEGSNSTNIDITSSVDISKSYIPIAIFQQTGITNLLNYCCYIHNSSSAKVRFYSNGHIVGDGGVTVYLIPVESNLNIIYGMTNGIGKVTTTLGDYQTKLNLVTSVSSSSTDSQYPSAKLFYDTCGDIETLINAL